MYVFEDNTSELEDWIRREIEFDEPIGPGMQGESVCRVQEWLNLQGYGLAIDGKYGPVTANVITQFQENSFINATGDVDRQTFELLVEPMKRPLRQRMNMSESINQAVLEYAFAHLESKAKEIGGQNMGPWVRLYMKGHQGKKWAWCAGFVSFVLHQAIDSLNADVPHLDSFSCDLLAFQAKSAGLFFSGNEISNREIPSGSIFLVRNTDSDWTHVGIIVEAEDLMMRTIEGNTNDEGGREGYEVCMRFRGYNNKDFILLP
ncbi:MAG: peptidoglycan-binding protein [Calditrichaeota bacterium]|nr:MAG: peptidoglycan-binding protein [Calditrichota bacterium]